MFKTTQTLYADLAKTLGVAELPADESGSVELTVGDDTPVILFAEDAYTPMLVAPVVPLPAEPDYGVMLWLMRRNFHDSPLAPFRVACDAAGTVNLWGRVPIDGMEAPRSPGWSTRSPSRATSSAKSWAADHGGTTMAEKLTSATWTAFAKKR